MNHAATAQAAPGLTPVANDLWAVEDTVALPGGLKMPVRMTVFRVPDGSLALHSPVALDASVVEAIRRLGPVGHIIAPSALHHVFVGPALKHFPDARLYGPPALARKRPRLRFDEMLEETAPTALVGVLDGLPIRGAPGVQEMVFLHKPTATLLVTDMLFNIRRPQGIATKLILSMTGTRGKLAQSRLWWVHGKDRRALRASGRRMLELPFDRLVPCHGDIVETDARAAVANALRWK